MRGEVLGVERRRRWRDEDKLSIVSSVGIDGATVTQIAHRCDVTRQQIYRWRNAKRRTNAEERRAHIAELLFETNRVGGSLEQWLAKELRNRHDIKISTRSIGDDLKKIGRG